MPELQSHEHRFSHPDLFLDPAQSIRVDAPIDDRPRRRPIRAVIRTRHARSKGRAESVPPSARVGGDGVVGGGAIPDEHKGGLEWGLFLHRFSRREGKAAEDDRGGQKRGECEFHIVGAFDVQARTDGSECQFNLDSIIKSSMMDYMYPAQTVKRMPNLVSTGPRTRCFAIQYASSRLVDRRSISGDCLAPENVNQTGPGRQHLSQVT